MGTDFNGGQINTIFTDVDSLPLLLIPFLYCWWSEAEAHGLDVKPIKTYSQTKVLYPAALWAGVVEYASSLVYFVQPLPAALLEPELPHCLCIPLFSWPRLIFYQQPAGVAGWHLSVGVSGCQPFRSQRWLTLFHFLCHFSLRVAAMPLRLISFEGVTAARRSGCTNRELISFFGLPPEAKTFDHFLCLYVVSHSKPSFSVGSDGSQITHGGCSWICQDAQQHYYN